MEVKTIPAKMNKIIALSTPFVTPKPTRPGSASSIVSPGVVSPVGPPVGGPRVVGMGSIGIVNVGTIISFSQRSPSYPVCCEKSNLKLCLRVTIYIGAVACVVSKANTKVLARLFANRFFT